MCLLFYLWITVDHRAAYRVKVKEDQSEVFNILINCKKWNAVKMLA